MTPRSRFVRTIESRLEIVRHLCMSIAAVALDVLIADICAPVRPQCR